MKNFGKGLLLFGVLSAGFVSCSDESPWSGSDSEGFINLNFSTDAQVTKLTRAADDVSPVVPDASRFGVKLVKSDNTYSKNWENVSAFNAEKSFPIGDYSLTATYGSLDVEGFDTPCYKGSTDVHVSPGATTDASVTATLANSMVSIRYTDAFIANFKAYSAGVQSEGHSDWVVYAQDEDRPAYVSPSRLKISLTLTNNSDQKTTIQPAEFTAEARHHYIVTVGVKGNVVSGDLTLDVQFDDQVDSSTVEVPLGDELFLAPAPTVEIKGVAASDMVSDSEAAISGFEYLDCGSNPEFHVFAYGGITEGTLTLATDGKTPSFGNSVSLSGSTDSFTQHLLEDAGVVCAGFFNNPDKMAVVNLKKFFETQANAEMAFTLQVKDALTRLSDPVVIKANINPVTMVVAATQEMGFMSDEVSVDVSTNCDLIKDKVTFRVPNENNVLVATTVKSVTAVSAPSSVASRSDVSYTFRYVLDIPRQIRESVNVEATFGKKVATVPVTMHIPEFEIIPDAYARKVVLKVAGENADEVQAVVNNLRLFNGGNSVVNTDIISTSVNGTEGYLTFKGVNAGTEYNYVAKLGSLEFPFSFTTETETDVPNGNFSQISKTGEFVGVNLGGKYRVTYISSHQNTANIIFYEPDGWASINQKTCYSESSPQNTWFMVPSTLGESGKVTLRSVGYNHSGTEPSISGGAAETKWYCQNAPSDSQLNKAAGELFLGSYSFSGGVETRVDGISHASRPSSLTFDYTYEPLNSEKGVVYVSLLDESGSKIFENTSYVESGTSSFTVPMDGYAFGKKAATLIVNLKSSNLATPAVNIPSGTALDEGNGLSETKNATTYKALATGSKLTVSNVHLNYDVVAPAAKPARKNRK